MSGPRIELDHRACARHGLCASVAPEVFSFGADGRVRVDPRRVDADALARAERLCPQQAISVLGEDER